MVGKSVRRVLYAMAAVCLLAVEVVIALYVHGFVRDYVGDVLAVICLYLVVRIFVPEGVRLLPLYVFAFACVVELLQYLDIVTLLGWSDVAFLRVLVGSVFDWSDIAAYAVGCGLLGVFEIAKKNVRPY